MRYFLILYFVIFPTMLRALDLPPMPFRLDHFVSNPESDVDINYQDTILYARCFVLSKHFSFNVRGPNYEFIKEVKIVYDYYNRHKTDHIDIKKINDVHEHFEVNIQDIYDIYVLLNMDNDTQFWKEYQICKGNILKKG